MLHRGSSPSGKAGAACRSGVVGPSPPPGALGAPGVRSACAQESLLSDGTVTQQWGNLKIRG